METGTEFIEQKAYPNRRSLILRAVIRFLVGIALLVLLFSLIETEKIIGAYDNANGLLIGLSFLLLPFNIGFQIAKWHVLLRQIHPALTLREATTSLLFGITLGTLTPGQIGEFGGRAFRLQLDQPGLIVGLTILDKLQVFGIMTVCGIWSLGFLFDVLDLLTVTLLSALTLLILLLLIRPVILRWAFEAIGLGRFRHRWIVEILQSLSIVKEFPVIAVTLALTILFYGTVFAQLYVLLNAFSSVEVLDAFVGFSSMMFVKSLLPITIGDLGTREAGLVYFLSLRGISGATSFNASLLLFSINLLLPALVGLFFLPRSFSFRKTE